MSATPFLRRLAASTAVAMAFASTAVGAPGLLDYKDDQGRSALGKYRPALSTALAKTFNDDAAHLQAGGFMLEVEKELAVRSDKPRFVVYPKTQSHLPVMAAVLPASGNEDLLPAGVVCAQQHNKALGAYTITNRGEVLPRPVLANAEGSTRPACNATLIAARDEFNARLAQTPASHPAQPPPERVGVTTAPVIAANTSPR